MANNRMAAVVSMVAAIVAVALAVISFVGSSDSRPLLLALTVVLVVIAGASLAVVVKGGRQAQS